MKYKIKKNYSGGGGDPQTNDTIPEWARPYFQKVGDVAVGAYDQGQLSKIAGASPLQEQAFSQGAQSMTQAGETGQAALSDQQGRLQQLAQTGGFEDLQDAMNLERGQQAAQIAQQFGGNNTLGSARERLAQAQSSDATLAKYKTQALQNKMAAEGALAKNVSDTSGLASNTTAALAKLGSEQRSIEQQELDSAATGLQRLSSAVYGNPARQQTTSPGGGK